MSHKVLVSSTFAGAFAKLPKATQRRIRAALEKLAEDPLTPRPGLDVKRLKATKPTKHRLRVGDFRIIYVVDARTVKVLDVFARERGYGE